MADRKRVWGFIAYPESLPERWEDILSDFHVAWAHSPLHDSDFNPDGEAKKPHYHCIFTFEGVQTFESVREISASVNATIPVPIKSIRGNVRYFCHLDNPEKHQYSPADIKCFCGADLYDLMAPTNTEKQAILSEIRAFIVEHDITEFYDFYNYADLNEHDTWFRLVNDSCLMVVREFIKSNRHRYRG